MKELDIEAIAENLSEVLKFVDAQLESTNCSPSIQMQIDMAAEELFVNIANYAYGNNTGPVKIRVEVKPDNSAVSITFIDQGVPYDPLAKADPDITLSADERPIGGLGIFIVKKCTDDIIYEHKNGCNILTIVKKLS